MSIFNIAAISVILSGLWWCIYHLLASLNHRKNGRKLQLPPGPRGLPIIGNLHMLGNLPHRTLEKLANKYGPIMYLQLGYVPTIVVSSPQAAKLFLKTHDNVFASRPRVQAAEYLAYGSSGIGFTEYGPYWRNVRKLVSIELLSNRTIESFAEVRRQEVGLLVNSIKEVAVSNQVVDLTEIVAALIENISYIMVFGRCKDDRFDLKDIVRKAFVLIGVFNLADYLPFLKPFDLQGLTRQLKATSKALDEVMEVIITEHEEEQHAQSGNDHQIQQHHHKDFIHLMLSLIMKKSFSTTHEELSHTLNRTNMKAIITDTVAAMIDTSHSAIDWTLTELIRHPRVMKKLQQELNDFVGIHRMVEERDLPKLNYLSMVIKESLRLHPVAPIFLPHESLEDVVVNGYYIPKKVRIFINYWAIGRDPKVWSDNVEEFIPERFVDKNIDLHGQDFELIPFGAGRRSCPGANLGLMHIQLVVAQLVHCFDWKLPEGMSIDETDMTEAFGLTAPRAKHLLAVPSNRLRSNMY
uniref:Cytochrome P450 n=1 Tax=Nothapodytes nimmoniana TaxID=159386 RepID=A0A7L7RB51_NOTNI|nr:cytochrome P450 [Nothapodytes nimmoniana]